MKEQQKQKLEPTETWRLVISFLARHRIFSASRVTSDSSTPLHIEQSSAFDEGACRCVSSSIALQAAHWEDSQRGA